ncbi:hypothetical protein [Sporosarcina sp. FSL K6-3457]|uniref:hypothetical protein n=1 Tax=Sporosarcina sp. FSL K6-3457 TaxID=2978204 RepID=UPI0030F9C592
MKKNKLIMKSSIATLLLVSSINLTNTPTTYANTINPEFENIENLKITDLEQSFTLLLNKDYTIDYNIETHDEKVIVTTITNGNVIHTFEYNKGDDFALIDGVAFPLEITSYIDQALVNHELENDFIMMAAADYTPIYVGTNRISFTKPVSDFADLATVIGGVIVISGWVGAKITKKEIVAKISEWASVIGLAGLIYTKSFTGDFLYDQYKTRGLVPTGYGTNQIAYRNDNARVIGSVWNNNINIQLRGIGPWWFADKPW